MSKNSKISSFFKKKSCAFWALNIAPTLDVPVLFLFFFRQTTDLIAYVPLFSTDLTWSTVNPAVTGSSYCFRQKLFRAFAKADETEGSPLSFFSATFSNFFAFKGSHLQVFLIFCSKLKYQKAQRVSPFMYFGHMKLFKVLIFRFFSKLKRNLKKNEN